MPMQRFLTVYDYGTGGVWQWITANSAAEITEKYPALVVVPETPKWMTELEAREVCEYDIEDAPDKVMIHFTKAQLPPA